MARERRIRHQVARSLDGYIAGPGDELPSGIVRLEYTIRDPAGSP